MSNTLPLLPKPVEKSRYESHEVPPQFFWGKTSCSSDYQNRQPYMIYNPAVNVLMIFIWATGSMLDIAKSEHVKFIEHDPYLMYLWKNLAVFIFAVAALIDAVGLCRDNGMKRRGAIIQFVLAVACCACGAMADVYTNKAIEGEPGVSSIGTGLDKTIMMWETLRYSLLVALFVSYLFPMWWPDTAIGCERLCGTDEKPTLVWCRLALPYASAYRKPDQEPLSREVEMADRKT